MKQKLLDFFRQPPDPAPAQVRLLYSDLEVASCILILGTALVDRVFTPKEQSSVLEVLQRRFKLEPHEAQVLCDQAASLLGRRRFGLFVETLDKGLTPAEKESLLENMWHIIKADSIVDPYEVAFINRTAGLLGISSEAQARIQQNLFGPRG